MKYTILPTSPYQKSYKRLKESGKFKKEAQKRLDTAIDIVASGQVLPREYQDHQLVGELREYRECHIKVDLLLVYQIRKSELLLILVDIGTHSYLGM